MSRNERLLLRISSNLTILCAEIAKRVQVLEKQIASLESKPPEAAPDRHVLDFERGYATKVPTGENESDMERLNARDVLADLCHCTCWECGRRR